MASTRGSPELSFPALLNAAHRRTTVAMQAVLARSGFGDLPVTGFRVVVVLARVPSRIGELANRLEVSKQGASRVVELLVQRGYCERVADPEDRRSGLVVLTRRGRRAVAALRDAVEEIEQALDRAVDEGSVAVARRVLEALCEMGAGESVGRAQ